MGERIIKKARITRSGIFKCNPANIFGEDGNLLPFDAEKAGRSYCLVFRPPQLLVKKKDAFSMTLLTAGHSGSKGGLLADGDEWNGKSDNAIGVIGSRACVETVDGDDNIWISNDVNIFTDKGVFLYREAGERGLSASYENCRYRLADAGESAFCDFVMTDFDSINHVALLPLDDEGRAGRLASISDGEYRADEKGAEKNDEKNKKGLTNETQSQYNQTKLEKGGKDMATEEKNVKKDEEEKEEKKSEEKAEEKKEGAAGEKKAEGEKKGEDGDAKNIADSVKNLADSVQSMCDSIKDLDKLVVSAVEKSMKSYFGKKDDEAKAEKSAINDSGKDAGVSGYEDEQINDFVESMKFM